MEALLFEKQALFFLLLPPWLFDWGRTNRRLWPRSGPSPVEGWGEAAQKAKAKRVVPPASPPPAPCSPLRLAPAPPPSPRGGEPRAPPPHRRGGVGWGGGQSRPACRHPLGLALRPPFAAGRPADRPRVPGAAPPPPATLEGTGARSEPSPAGAPHVPPAFDVPVVN